MPKLNEIINTTIKEFLFEQHLNEGWFHGSADARNIEKESGFDKVTMSVDYITDVSKYNQIQQQLKQASDSGDEDAYFKLIDIVPTLKKQYTYNKPIFLTDKYSVAKTYADPQRAFDYQGAEEKVFEVDVDCTHVVNIIATGDRFRFIGVDKVKNGFINAGISEEEIDELIMMFNFYINGGGGIKTDTIAAIGNFLKFDCIDVVGVLDSYHGGSIKSTVRMVLDPTKVNIKK